MVGQRVSRVSTAALLLLTITSNVKGLQPQQRPPSTATRRRALTSVISGAATVLTTNNFIDAARNVAWAAADASSQVAFENRDRKNNKNSLIREDYWYLTGKLPPRLLTNALQGDDPQFNAFGSCVSADGGNPCTYVSLKQRGPAYTKYASTIFQGAREYQTLGKILHQQSSNPSSWAQEALPLIRADLGAAAVDAELKLILLATALTTSPNFPGPSKELLVARFYANEIHYAQDVLRMAIESGNQLLAVEAWEFGKDSWNSYFQVINRSISPKVGDKFELIE